MLLAAGFVVVFGWIIAWQNYGKLSGEVSGEKQLTREALSDTLDNLSDVWADYEKKIINRYETEAVFASLALKNVIGDGDIEDISEVNPENSMVISIQDGELSASDPSVRTLGLDASLFPQKQGSFAAPNQPSTFVVYSRIGDTSEYFVKWYEDIVPDDVVREAVDLPGILKWTEISYGVSAIFVSCDPESGEISEILYKNNRYFSDCESLEELGLTREDLVMNGEEASGTLNYDGISFSYVSGESALPEGFVILLEPLPDLFVKAFVQEGYMVACLMVLVITLIVGGFSLYPYVLNNILTPEEEKNYLPSHVRSITSLFGVFGLIMIAVCGMFSYALDVMYNDVLRG